MPSYRACKRKDCTNVVEYWSRKFYCSDACKMRDYRARTNKHYNVKENPHNRRCRECGIKFTTYSTLGKYCSDACRQRFYREQRQLNDGTPHQLPTPESAYTISNTIT
jgi:hypothetical protein